MSKLIPDAQPNGLIRVLAGVASVRAGRSVERILRRLLLVDSTRLPARLASGIPPGARGDDAI